jgi:ubiquinone/menaquinone biosynthesis C-methylase UbiE
LKSLLPILTEKDVLDIGCGTGRWLETLLLGGARSAAGIDLSAAMLAIVRPKPSLSGRLVRADCFALPVRSNTADLVICSFVVEHISNLSALARELARVTRPGGDYHITDVHPMAYAHGWRTGFRHATGSAEVASFGHSFAEIRDSLGAQGFALVHLFEPRLGEPERPIFARTGRVHYFREATKVPALFISHFIRLGAVGSTV